MYVVPRVLVIIATLLVSVASADTGPTYESFKAGTLTGKVLVEWLEAEKYLFVPDNQSPLSFTRSNGDKIVPARLLTDGSSIPRDLWILRNYTVGGYGPAFIIHDWLFEMHHCKLDGWEKYDYGIAATVVAEVMKTLMETKKVSVAPINVMAIYTASDSDAAKELWDNGKCEPPPVGLAGTRPITEYKLSYD